MRFWNQTKPAQPKRPFRTMPLPPYSPNPEDHMITRVKKDAVPYKVPKEWIKQRKYEVKKKDIVEVSVLAEDEELHALCQHTMYRGAGDRNDWMHWVWAMKGAGVKDDDIHSLSYDAKPDSYKFDDCQNLIRDFQQEKTSMGRHTLELWAQQNGYDVERQIEVKAEVQPVQREEHMTWLDLQNKYQDALFGSIVEACYAIRGDVSKVVSMIQGAKTLFRIYSNDENQFKLTSKDKFPSLILNIGTSEKFRTIRLEKLMEEKPLHFPRYNKIVFKPNDHKLRKHELNTYPGFKAQEVSEVNMDLVQPFLTHIEKCWAAGNKDHYKWIMSWLAQIVQTPWKPTDVAIVLQSGQGTGKTLPCNFLINHVFGRNLSLSTTGLSSLTQRFNDCVRGKLFINANELSICDSDGFNNAFDKMKSYITDRVIQIEPKYEEPLTIDNMANFIFTTNHSHTIKLEADDRRYACFEVSDCYKNDEDYFEKLIETFTDEGGCHVYQYLKDYPKQKMVNVRKIPKTKLKEDMIHHSKHSVVRFMDTVMNGEIIDEFLFDVNQDERKVSNKKLYEHYKIWCDEFGEKRYANNKFGSMIPKHMIVDRGNDRVCGVKQRWLQLMKPECE